MVDRDHILRVLRSSYGDFNTTLDNQYSNTIVNEISDNKTNVIREWLTYHQVILELKKTDTTVAKAKEIQYRITDGEHPKNVCLDVIKELTDSNSELKRLFTKINNF